jgi:Lon protease-like protein
MSAPAPNPPAPPSTIVVPIFPLPDVTLFPLAVMPLHVFEARYRAMVTDALARDRRLCLARLEPGWDAHYEGKPPVARIAGAGEIVSWERLSTGRYNIVVKGEWRVHIDQELPTDTLYRMVAAHRLADAPAAPGADLTPVLAHIGEACRRLLDAIGRPRTMLDPLLADGQGPGAVADRIAAAVLPDAALRQELLEMLDVGRRLERLSVALDALVKELRGGG